VTALHFGPLALVQPILAVELLFVFGYLAIRNAAEGGDAAGSRVRRGMRRKAAWRDWLAAAAMSAGVALFLTAASPSGGRAGASATAWWTAGLATLLVVTAAIAASRARPALRSYPAFRSHPESSAEPLLLSRPEPSITPPGSATAVSPALVDATSPAWRAACLGIATGILWGFVAAIIKELSDDVTGGPAAIFTTWPAYALMATGAAAMLLTAHAMAAGPLAAAQPGITIFDPVTAAILGVVLYGEQVRNTPLALTAEVIGLLALAIGVRTLTRSTLLTPPVPAGTQESGRQSQYHP
jgi:hypothetical protein